MIDLSTNGYSHNFIRDVLHADSGSRHIAFSAQVIRNSSIISEIPISGTISYQSDSSVKRTAKFEIPFEKTEINWLTDRIKPYAHFFIGNTEVCSFPMGVFIPSSPEIVSGVSGKKYSVEAYDLNVILKEDCLTDRVYFKAGSKYFDAIKSVFSGITDPIDAEEDDSAFPTDREFEIGDNKLYVINTLLSEINYKSVYVNSDGIFQFRKYVQPTIDNVMYAYYADELSVIGQETTVQADAYKIPNVFIAVLSNPELGDLRSVYVNENILSPLSTVRRGRTIVSDVQKPDMVSSQSQLDEYIKKFAFEQSQVYETSKFQTAIMPFHGDSDVLYIEHPDLNGIFTETSWSIPLEAGGMMDHEVRRIIEI